MASGSTTTDALADSLPTVISQARQVREYEARMPNLVEKKTLGRGMGLSWNEVTMAQLTAQAITESTDLDNPQQLSDTLFTITPTVVGIETRITDRVAARISKNSYAQTGSLAQHAVERKKDEDGLTVLATGTTIAGAGVTLTSGHISASVARIGSNATEPSRGSPIRFVGHGFQIKDIQDEIVAGLGTYAVPEGPTARIFRDGFRGTLFGAGVFEDGNITIDGSDDASGGVFPQESIVMVQGRSPKVELKRLPEYGGGATAQYHYDEYAYGERTSSGTSVWLFRILSDAATPTS